MLQAARRRRHVDARVGNRADGSDRRRECHCVIPPPERKPRESAPTPSGNTLADNHRETTRSLRPGTKKIPPQNEPRMQRAGWVLGIMQAPMSNPRSRPKDQPIFSMPNAVRRRSISATRWAGELSAVSAERGVERPAAGVDRRPLFCPNCSGSKKSADENRGGAGRRVPRAGTQPPGVPRGVSRIAPQYIVWARIEAQSARPIWLDGRKEVSRRFIIAGQSKRPCR